MKIFIIDPTGSLFSDISLLKKREHILNTVTDIGEVLEKVKTESPDLVFLNLDISEGGLALLEKMLPFAPNIVVSSEWATFSQDAIEAGAAHFLEQPISKLAIKDILEKYGKAKSKAEEVHAKAATRGGNFSQKSNSEKRSENSKQTKTKRSAKTANPKHLAFIIACENYPVKPLSTPIYGAQTVAKILEDTYNYKVELLLDPNKERMLEFLKAIPDKVQESNSKVILFYGGHGFMTTGEKGKEGFFVPIDGQQDDKNSLISYDELISIFEDQPETYIKDFLFINDCCYSGGFRFSLGGNKRALEEDNFRGMTKQKFKLYQRNPSWQSISSTSDRQMAFDVFTKDKKFSPFTFFLKEGLNGQADQDHDNIIRGAELFTYIQKELELYYMGQPEYQSAGLFPMKAHQNGDFIFFLKDFDVEKLHDEEIENPYKALDSYTKDDKDLFFGRAKEVKAAYDKFIDKETKILIIVGASGSGKSSLVNAGLLPKVIENGIQKPYTSRPSKNIKLDYPEGCDLLVIDQFEELFNGNIPKDERISFVNKIKDFVERKPAQGDDLSNDSQPQPDSGTNARYKAILTLRGDFEVLAKGNSEPIWPYWDKGIHYVNSFSYQDLLEIVSSPTARYGIDFKPFSLRETIALEVSRFEHSTPLLSFAMHQFCEQCMKTDDDYWVITEEAYEKIGKIQGGIKTKADKVYNELSEKGHGKLMSTIMLRMLAFSEDRRMRQPITNLDLFGLDGFDQGKIDEVLGKLAEERLIVANTRIQREIEGEDKNQGQADIRYYELSHDALIDSWDRMIEWINITDPSRIKLITDLKNDSKSYFNGKKNDVNLWHGTRLSEIDAYRKNPSALIRLTKNENEFINRSGAKERKDLAWIRFVKIASVLAVIITVGVSVWGLIQDRITERKRIEEELKTRNSRMASIIDSLGRGISDLNADLTSAKGLRIGEQYDGALSLLATIDSLQLVSLENQLNGFLSDTFVQRRGALVNKINGNLGESQQLRGKIRAERDTCLNYKALWIKYTGFKNAGDGLRVYGDDQLLNAYRKYRAAKAVGYKPRSPEIASIVRETGDNLKRVYNTFMGFGDVRLKAKNPKSALDAYKYAREIAVDIGLPIQDVDRRINQINSRQ